MKKISLALLGSLALLVGAYVSIPPLHRAQAQFTDQSTYVGTSGGSANAQTITLPNASQLPVGVPIRLKPGNTNTGATVLNTNSFGNVAVLRWQPGGNVALSGGELVSGVMTTIIYDGTNWVITSPFNPAIIGSSIELRGPTAPTGYILEDGSCISRTTYAPLFAVVGTTYGVCDGSTTFGIPDSRGQAFAALDNQGVNGAASRLTSPYCSATAVGSCGSQTFTMIQANLPAINFGVTDPGHSHSGVPTANGFSLGSNGYTGGSPGTNNFLGYSTGFIGLSNFNTGTATTGISVQSGGSSTPMANVPPLSLGRRAIKY